MIMTEMVHTASVLNPDRVGKMVEEVREIEGGGIAGNEMLYAFGRALVGSVCSAIITRAALGAYRWKDSVKVEFKARVESAANVYRFASLKNLSRAVSLLYKTLSEPIDRNGAVDNAVSVGLHVQNILATRAALCYVMGGKRLIKQDVDDGCEFNSLGWESRTKNMCHVEDKIIVAVKRGKLDVAYHNKGLRHIVMIYPSGLSEVYRGKTDKTVY